MHGNYKIKRFSSRGTKSDGCGGRNPSVYHVCPVSIVTGEGTVGFRRAGEALGGGGVGKEGERGEVRTVLGRINV